MGHKKSIGLPGGPNEFLQDITQYISIEGYKNDSPDKNNPVNIIESSNITMEGVDFPVRGYGNNGVVQDMTPGTLHYDYGNADYVVEVPMAQNGTEIPDEAEAAASNNSFLYDLEKLVNKLLGDINNKAKDFSENPEEMNSIDNMRHASGGRYAAEAIQQKVKDIPYLGGLLDFVGVDKAAGFIGSNAMGVGHELRTIFGGDERPFLAKLQEMGEDIFNNYVGSIVGSLSIDDSKKDKVIKYLSYNNLLPDGYVRTEQGKKDGFSEDIYFKDEDGKRKTAYQRGGALPKAQDGTEVRVDYGDENIKKLSTDSAEYRKLYNEGMLGVKNYDGSISMGSLPEVTVTVDKQTGKNILEDYPYYNQLNEEEKKYFRDSGPIGRQIRSKAADGVGFNADKATDFVMAWLRDLPLASLQAPQSALVEGVEGLRGNESNMLDTFIPGKQRIPSDVWGFKTTDDMSWYNPRVVGNFAMDMFADPLNVVGVGVADDILKLGLKQGLKKVGRETTGGIINFADNLGNAYLPNAYKVNPWAFKANPQVYYHRSPDLNNIINRESRMLQGFGESKAGKLYSEFAASNPGGGINLLKGPNTRLYFSKGVPLDYGRYNPKSSGMSGQGYRGPYIAEVEGVPMGSSVKGRAPKSTPPLNVEGYAVSRRPIALDEANFYKEDWLRGYKQIDPLKKQNGGSTTNPYTVYMNYINGIDESEVAQNIFDKLNRMHYRDAKTRGMGVANYIATNIIPNS